MLVFNTKIEVQHKYKSAKKYFLFFVNVANPFYFQKQYQIIYLL